MSVSDAKDVKKTHEIRLLGRSQMSVSGVCEVVSFDEDGVRLTSLEGELIIEGEGIKVGVLDTERGVVTLSGKIDGFFYLRDAKNEKKGLFSRRSK